MRSNNINLARAAVDGTLTLGNKFGLGLRHRMIKVKVEMFYNLPFSSCHDLHSLQEKLHLAKEVNLDLAS